MKVGDRLYCYCVNRGDDCIDYGRDFIIGNWYIVTSIDFINMTIFINSENNVGQWFYIFKDNSSDNVWYYGYWFYTNRDLRRIKLDRLEDYESWWYEDERLS